MSSKAVVRVGITGLGGYAGTHHNAILALERAGECRLVCTCDPAADAFAGERARWEFDRRGVRVYAALEEMLARHAGELDVVTVPTPILLHAAMHRACVESGVACYLEKPPTLYAPELEEMLAVERRARRATVVGFNFIADPVRQQAKARLAAGEFGAVRRIAIEARWPRDRAYFRRNAWAGRLVVDGRPVLDAVVGNAVAHQIHNGLFWAGAGDTFSWGRAESVEAELYRAHAIESFDTVFARARLDSGAEFVVTATHTGSGGQSESDRVEAGRATLRYRLNGGGEIRWADGRVEALPAPRTRFAEENFVEYFRYLRGERPRPLTRLEDSRPFVEWFDLLFLASGGIGTVPPPALADDPATGKIAFTDYEPAAQGFRETGRMPSAQGFPWARAGGRAQRADLARLPALVAALAGAASPRT